MRKNTCELVRRELDELMLDETCSTAVLGHLRECGACREFHEKQTKLRQIVGSLGTVSAPADFAKQKFGRCCTEPKCRSERAIIDPPTLLLKDR